jgi:hypothetical protein
VKLEVMKQDDKEGWKRHVFHMTGHMNATVTENYPLSLWEGAREWKVKVCRSMCTKGNLLPNLFHWDSTLSATDLEHNKVKNYLEVTLTIVQLFAYSNLNKVCQVLRSKNQRSNVNTDMGTPINLHEAGCMDRVARNCTIYPQGDQHESLFSTPEVQLTK